MLLDNRSRSRRKPLRTYKSPAAEDQIFIPRVVESSASSSSSKCKATRGNKSSSRTVEAKKESGMWTKITIRCRCPQSPPLPLFHPLGKLAMSLPPLDPTLYGLPVLAIVDEVEERHGRRTKNGGGKMAEEEVDSTSVRQDMSAIAAVAARERASPRKRRAGAVNKRKRKDGDDGDATYPAKRTRIPRGQNGGEEETGHDSASNVETVDEMVEKRRSMRSRGGPIATKSRESTDSSGSNTTGIDDHTQASNPQKEQEL